MIVKNFEKKEKNTVSFDVEVDKGEFEAAINKVYIRQRKNISVPGFRKGKAPRMVIEGMYGSGVFHEDAVGDLCDPAFGFAVKELKLEAVGQPKMANMDISEEKILTLSFESAVYPEVTLGQYKELEAPRKAVEVTDADVDAELDRERRKGARLVTVERPAAMGDIAVIDFEGFLDGVPFEGGKAEGHSLNLGSGEFIPGFEEQVTGMTAGEERDINITFPEDYQPDLAGKAVVFHIKLHEVKENELPELDDEFAKDVSEFDTLDEYKSSLRENLQNTREKEALDAFNEALLQKAADNMTAEIPDAMVREKQEEMIENFARNLSMQGISFEDYMNMTGADYNSLLASTEPGAVSYIKNSLVLEKIAEVEGFTADEEEVEAEYASVAESYKVELDVAKKAISEEAVIADLKLKKASELIYSTGIAVEPEEAAADEPTDEPEAE